MQAYRKFGKYFFIGAVIITTIIFADQYTKWFVMDHLLTTKTSGNMGFFDWFTTFNKIQYFVEEREVFKSLALMPHLNLVMVWNQGISFGMFDNIKTDLSLVFIAVSLLAALLLVIWMVMTTHKYIALSLSMIIGGALANVSDRIRFGAVVDFIDLYIGKYHWPAFNLADSCIAIGAAIMLVITFMDDEGK